MLKVHICPDGCMLSEEDLEFLIVLCHEAIGRSPDKRIRRQARRLIGCLTPCLAAIRIKTAEKQAIRQQSTIKMDVSKMIGRVGDLLLAGQKARTKGAKVR